MHFTATIYKHGFPKKQEGLQLWNKKKSLLHIYSSLILRKILVIFLLYSFIYSLQYFSYYLTNEFT